MLFQEENNAGRWAARSLVLGALVAALGLASSAHAADNHAATPPATAFPKGHYAQLNTLPDWGGVWTYNYPVPSQGAHRSAPALQGKYLQAYQSWQREVKAHHGEAPHQGSYCRPPGMPLIMMVGQYPIEFLFTPGRVTIHYEAWMQWRNIYTDGRSHPADLDPTFYGDSIGHWQGDTLVVDTVGLKQIVQIGQGMGHSDRLHIVERMHLAKGDPNTLVDEMTLYDPVALAKPWSTTLTYQRSRNQQLLEFICEENDRN